MNLFDEQVISEDWSDVCPNADIDLPDDEKLGVFDLGRMFLHERDRHRVAHALHTGQCNRQYLMYLLVRSDPLVHQGLFFAARELYQKVSDSLLCSVLAFSHGDGSRNRLQFPEKHHKIPKRLMEAFGLRSHEVGWFYRLADNEAFIRGIGNQILPQDWKHIPLYDTTLLETLPKEATAPQLEERQGGNLW